MNSITAPENFGPGNGERDGTLLFLEGENRGEGDDDERIETEGCLGELIASRALKRSGPEIVPLVAHKPDSTGLDVTYGGKRLDGKSLSQGCDCVCVNHQTSCSQAG